MMYGRRHVYGRDSISVELAVVSYFVIGRRKTGYCKPPKFRDTKCLRFSNLERFATYYVCDFEFYYLYVRVLVHGHS